MNKNTAACICLSAFFINRYFDDSIMIVVPSDHIIKNEDKFIKILKSAIEKAKIEDNLILLGIKPFYPETGYGYIKINKSNKECINNNNVYKVEKFIDKPDYKTTVTYIQNEDYFWNSGIFIWKTSTILKAINKYMPDLYIDLNKINNYFNINKDELLYKEYSKFKSISIDKGVLEKASNIYAIIGDFGWDDLGSWTSLDRLYKKDDNGNIIKGNIINISTKNCIIIGNKQLITTLGINDIIVVNTEDVLLICSKNQAQNIKEILNELKKRNIKYI